MIKIQAAGWFNMWITDYADYVIDSTGQLYVYNYLCPYSSH